MRKEGKLNYLKLMNSTVKRRNYFIAVIALKYEIASAQNDPATKSHKKFNPVDFYKYGMSHLEEFYGAKFESEDLTKDEQEMFEFYALLEKHGDIFRVKHEKVGNFIEFKRKKEIEL